MSFIPVSISSSFFLSIIAFTILSALYIKSKVQTGSPKLPPGPRGLPILGNALQLPAEHLATYFKKLQAQYGGLVHLNLNGKPVIVISDVQLARDLLEKKSIYYSSRPVFRFTSHYFDPTGIYWGVARLGENHFHGRKISVSLMNTVKAGQTEALQRFEALLTLQHLLDDGGKNWYEHVNRGTASATLGIMFGTHFPKGDEAELRRVLEATRELTALQSPSFTLLNIFPVLDYIPGAMPWRKTSDVLKNNERQAYQPLITEAVEGSRASINTWVSFFAKHKTGDGQGDRRELIKVFTAAAIDTTSNSLHNFVLACIMYPDFLQIAQKELDAVVGKDRLPTFSDRPYLPYIEAVLREVLRWRPVVRAGIPHETTEKDEVNYNGEIYTIPKGSIVYYNVWAMEHDEGKYLEPDRFQPERFLGNDGLLKADYSTTAFGFGRRMCIGIPFAERALFINITLLLWTFNILKSPDIDPKTGNPFQYHDGDTAFDGEITNGAFTFPAIFEPRDAERVVVARREWEYNEKDLEQLLPQRHDS